MQITHLVFCHFQQKIQIYSKIFVSNSEKGFVIGIIHFWKTDRLTSFVFQILAKQNKLVYDF